MIYLGVGFFGLNLFGTLWASWTCVSSLFTRLRKFSAIISQSLAHSLLLLVFPWCRYCYASCCPKCLLSSTYFFFNSFSFCCLAWVVCFCFCFFPTLSSKSLIWSSASSNLLLIPSSVLFISDISFFISGLSFFYHFYVYFPTVQYTYNYYSKLLINCLPPFHLVLLLENTFVLSFGVCFFVFLFWLLLCICLYVLDDSARLCCTPKWNPACYWPWSTCLELLVIHSMWLHYCWAWVCAERLRLHIKASTRPGYGSAEASELSARHLCLQVFSMVKEWKSSGCALQQQGLSTTWWGRVIPAGRTIVSPQADPLGEDCSTWERYFLQFD